MSRWNGKKYLILDDGSRNYSRMSTLINMVCQEIIKKGGRVGYRFGGMEAAH